MIEEVVRFRELKYASLVLFSLALVMIPINGTASAIFMFALVGLWSRVPAFLSPLTKDAEILDFLSVVIALSLGGLAGGLFGFLLMLFSRIFAPMEYPGYALKDAVSLFVAGYLTPLLFFITGGNMFLTMYGFTAIRYIMYLLLTALFEPQWMGLELGYCFVGIFTAYISNTIMISLFGDFTISVLETGVGFNAGLFVFAGIAMFFMFLTKIIDIAKSRKGKESPENLGDSSSDLP